MHHPKLTVLLPTYNCADIVRGTLESVAWADEILVVDSFSRDSTLDICREYGAKVIQHEYINSAKQKNWAIPQCGNEWVLQVDSDEVLEPGLSDEIRDALCGSGGQSGFRIPFKHHVMGKWVKVCNLYPEYHARLFRRDSGAFEDKEVHAHFRVQGQVGTLNHHILHYGMPNLSKQLRNLDRYSRYQANEYKKRGKRFGPSQLLVRPLAVFAYYYFHRGGFRAGMRGLMLSANAAIFDFWSHAKLWELDELRLERSPET